MPIEPLLGVELGPLRFTVVGAVVTTVVTTIVGAGLVWLGRAARRRLSARRVARQEELHADHMVIRSGWSYGDLVGASTEFLACVRVAPSKSFPAPVRLDVGRVAPLVRAGFGALFPSEPEISIPADRVRYRAEGPGYGSIGPYVQVWPTGLIEATAPVAHTAKDSGELFIPLIEIARALLPAIRAIQNGGYQDAFGPGAAIPLGLDWEIKLSRELVGPASTPWVGLEFLGRAAAGRATGHRPPWPSPGFGHDQLLSVSTDTPPEDILMPALADLADQSGYYGLDDALSDLRATIQGLTDQSPASPTTSSDVPGQPATPAG